MAAEGQTLAATDAASEAMGFSRSRLGMRGVVIKLS
jgi:hypothetical protein